MWLLYNIGLSLVIINPYFCLFSAITSDSSFPSWFSYFFFYCFFKCRICFFILFWIQGLGWYAKRLRIDEDGDVADEFLDEVSSHTSASMEEQHRPLPTFEVRYNTRPAKVKSQVLTPDGKIQQCVEYQGRLQWVWRTFVTIQVLYSIPKVC